jgi:hypothetical protein
MKAQHLLFAFAAMVIVACNNKPDSIQSFIPGTYVNSAKGDFGQAEDTLIIDAVSNNTYLITRRTGYHAFRDGKVLPKRYKLQKLAGFYDAQKQVLNETTNGRVFSFEPDKRLLKVNKATYTKL